MDALPSTQISNLLKIDNPITIPSHPKIQTCLSTRASVCRQGTMTYAHHPLDEIPHSDSFSWNSLMQTHLANKRPGSAVYVYYQMLIRGIHPDNHTIPRVLTACRLAPDLLFAKQVHAHAFKFGLSSDVYVVSALIDIYGRLESVETAKCVFDSTDKKNSVSWTMLAKLYLMEKKPFSALDLFNRMVESNRAHVDSVSLATAIGACAMLRSLQQGRKVHEIAKKCGFESDVLVCNSLCKMYIECDSLEEARDVFLGMPCRDIISWTEMVRGHVKKGRYNEGLKLFRLMNGEGIKPDPLAFSSVLPACGRMAANKQGKEIHCFLLRNGIDMNITVQNAIMDMYVKSGSIESASNVFTNMIQRDTVSWTVMILGYSLHGNGKAAMNLFHEMEELNIETDQLTLSAVLHACCGARMVDDAKYYFSRIREPKVMHYALIVSLLARSGLFDDARNFIDRYQVERKAEVLRALLDGYRVHQQNQVTVKKVVEKLCDLEPLNAENYVLLSNWHSENAKPLMVERIRETIRDMGLKPRRAYSWIEHRSKVHVFGTGDVSHPRSEKIYIQLRSLRKKMKQTGFVFVSDYSLHDVDEERECVQIGHSEMLAISFGLITTKPQTSSPVRVTKNHRVCRCCHESAKFISGVMEREIIVKDPGCFHHFRDGVCSCGDFW